jgi:putative secretion ATPase (PEP-CTERM system associated)
MYESYYGLSANPFRLAPDPQFFYASTCHKRGLAYLRYGLHQGQGFVVVTGVPGTGKSLLVQTIFAELAGRRMVVSSINNTNLEADDTLRAVANSFDVYCSDSTKAALLNALEKFLIEKHRQGKRVLLIVDEAQNLPQRSLEELRMLSNFQRGDQPLMQVMLLGQQQLQQILADPNMEQLTQRVIASCHLKPLEPAETRGYIEHRLRHVGWSGKPSFTGETLGLIHHCTQGIPRLINTFTDRLLLAAYLDEKAQIDADHLRMVLHELQNEAMGAWQGINLNVASTTALPPLPDGEFIPEEKSVAVAAAAEKKAAEPTPDAAVASEPPKAFKPKLYKSEPAAPVVKAATPSSVGGRVAMSARQVTALAQHSQNERGYAALKMQSAAPALAPSPPPELLHRIVADEVIGSNVIPLPLMQPQIDDDDDDQPPALVYKDTGAIMVRRWWFVIGTLAVIVLVALLVMIFNMNGDKIGQTDLLQPMQQNRNSVAQPAQRIPNHVDAVQVVNTTSVAQITTDPAPMSVSIRQPVVKQPPVRTTIAADPPSPARAPGLVAEPAKSPIEHGEIIAVAATKPSISEVELPGLLNSYVFAYESGDLNRFVDLFATNAVVNESIGRNKISRDYSELFQATDTRRMKIGAIKWRSEGDGAQGNGEFEVTVWRRGDSTPSTIKGSLNIEVAKEDKQLVIRKLTHVVSR